MAIDVLFESSPVRTMTKYPSEAEESAASVNGGEGPGSGLNSLVSPPDRVLSCIGS